MIGLILDGVIIVLLGATIFYAALLSVRLKNFREGRSSFEAEIRELSKGIEGSLKAVSGMRNAAEDAGNDLQRMITQARALSEELQLMHQAGDSLAARLEKLAETNSGGARVAIADTVPPAGAAADSGLAARKRKAKAEGPSIRPDLTNTSFSIRDREFEEEGDSSAPSEDADWLPSDSFQSRAEQELFNALMGKKTKKDGGDRV